MTSNDIQPAEQFAPLRVDPSDIALERILKQAAAMDAAHKLGTALSGTNMVPAHFQGKPDDATAAILYGSELGMSAIQSLQQLFVVRGRPAMYARSMLALVQAAGHRMAEVESSDTSVTWWGQRADNGDELTCTWTMDRARQAGFTGNKIYQSMPVEMLRAKAQTEVARNLFADVLAGLYSREELDLDELVRVPSEQVRPNGVDAVRARLAAARTAKPVAAPVETPETVDAEVAPEEPGQTADAATTAQIRKLNILIENEGITDRAEKLRYLAGEVGRELSSSKELNRSEASGLIDALEQAQAADAAATVRG